jgi:LuxR family transcriptional regulator, maltose regulon positive regulatory protein
MMVCGVLGKFSRTEVDNAYPRQRLFANLDQANTPLIWIEGAAASGKTTLVSSYIQFLDLPCVWYCCDTGDSQPETFFSLYRHCLTARWPELKNTLPFLTPEYAFGLRVFARRYFGTLFEFAPAPLVLVFDNIQDLPEDAPLLRSLRAGLEWIPRGVRVFFISRSAPPPVLSRLLFTPGMTRIDDGQLRLTMEEAAGIAARLGNAPARDVLAECLRTVQGWTGGFLLLLETMRMAKRSGALSLNPHQTIFDFFAGELFNGLPTDTRNLLLKTAMLPCVTPDIARELTGLTDAREILHDLARGNLFTQLRPGPEFSYHDLFKTFLQERAEKHFSSEELAALRKSAAVLFMQVGDLESAIALGMQAGDWECAGHVIVELAPSLLEQGRGALLEDWLRALPAGVVSSAPWLSYWLGMSLAYRAPEEAHGHFSTAHGLFVQHEQWPGAFLAWAGAVESLAYSYTVSGSFARWRELLGMNLRAAGGYPDSALEVRTSCAMVHAMVMDGWSSENDVAQWVERILAHPADRHDLISPRMQAIYQFAIFLTWKGSWDKAWKLHAEIEELTSAPDTPPMARISTLLLKSLLSSFACLTDTCIGSVEKGLEIAAHTGMRVQDHFLLAQAVGTCLETGAPEKVDGFLNRLDQLVEHMRPWDRSLYHLLHARRHLIRGEFHSARERLSLAQALAERVGHPFAISLQQPLAALISHHLGDAEAADALLDKGLRLARKSGYRTTAYMNMYMAAGLGLLRGDRQTALDCLERALPQGRGCGMYSSQADSPGLAARLYALALDWEIEPDYVRECIKRRMLRPPQEARALEHWPWAVKVRTLGGFSVHHEERLLPRSSKTPKKLLEMLQILLAHAGNAVTPTELMDRLWPEALGDTAEHSLKNAVHRLRKLLGHGSAVLHEYSGVAMNQEVCWVDFQALLLTAEEISRTCSEPCPDERMARRIALLAKRAASLHRGPYLPRLDDARDDRTRSLREKLEHEYRAGLDQAASWLRQSAWPGLAAQVEALLH